MAAGPRAGGRMPIFVPIPRRLAGPFSGLVLLAWLVQMAWLVHDAYGRPAAPLAADLARYAQDAQWRGVYYRGDKIGFVVGQTRPTADGFEIREDGQLQMLLLGSSQTARLKTVVQVDAGFELKSFEFALDPGGGPMEIRGRLDGTRLLLTIESRAGRREEVRELGERPVLSLNLPRRLAALGLRAGQRHTFASFDPATLRNAPMTLEVQAREVVWSQGRPVPAFRVVGEFQGLATRSWVTDVGEVVREESPMGLLVVRETRERALSQGVPGDVQGDILAMASVPASGARIDDPFRLDRLRLRLPLPASLEGPDLQGDGQARAGDELTIVSARRRQAEPTREDLAPYLRAEAFIESDAPEIQAEARTATAGARDARGRVERLVGHVARLLEKKPTVSVPSALEVLRTRVGDCNEHTVLFVALARAAGIPARVAIGLVYMRGAFYYHAWPEVYLSEAAGRGLWMPVDPTLNQLPADPSHVRLARGGLDRQTAILPLVGQARIEVLEAQVRPDYKPLVVGQAQAQTPPLALLELPRATGGRRGCWSDPGN